MVRTPHFSQLGARVQSLVGELRSRKTHGTAKKEEENKNTAYQNLYGAGAPTGKFIAFISLNVYMRKEGKTQINNLSFYLKKLEKKSKNKLKAKRMKK